jgi:hypothetical protein
MRSIEIAFGLIHVCLRDGGAYVFQCEALGGKRHRVRLDTHRRLLPAADADQTDA